MTKVIMPDDVQDIILRREEKAKLHTKNVGRKEYVEREICDTK